MMLYLVGAPSSRAAETATADATIAPDSLVDDSAAASDSSAIPTMRVRVAGTPVAVLRAGPGEEHALVATALEEDILVVDARTGPWYHVTGVDGASGWVHRDLVRNDVDRERFRFRPDPGKRQRQRTLALHVFLGSYAADREDNGLLLGARLGYAVTPRFTFEVGIGRTRIVRSTYVIEQLYNLRLEEEDFQVFFYEAGVAMDLLPGRRVAPFVAAGVGATILNARVEPTWSIALGTRAYLSRTFALRWEIRDHRLEAGNQFTRFQADNLEFSAGMELQF
jgi:hypothetical protein